MPILFFLGMKHGIVVLCESSSKVELLSAAKTVRGTERFRTDSSLPGVERRFAMMQAGIPQC